MADITPKLALLYLQASQADKHVNVNAALTTLDNVVQAAVMSRTMLAQPVSPVEGDTYVLPVGKTGTSWATLPDHALAVWLDGNWQVVATKTGFMAFVQNEEQHIVRTATGWAPLGAQVSLPTGGEPLINGAFAIWQRGTALTLAAGQAGFLADRWRYDAGIGGAASLSRITVGGGTLGLPEWAYYGLRCAQTTASSVPPRIEQRLENLRRFGASTVTFSAFVRVSSGSVTITPKAILNFGSGGPATVAITASSWTVTNVWQRLSATFSIPSISATTTLEWLNNYLSVGLDLPTGATVTLDMCACQLDTGPVAALARAPDSVNELPRCQRYFAKTFAIETAPAPNTIDGGGVFQTVYSNAAYTNILPWSFPVPMRAIPQISTFNPYSATGTGMALAGAGNFILDTYAINQNGVMLRNTQTLTGAPLPVNLHVTANAEL